MKKKAVSVAYPTIPIVFVSSVHPDRIPLHNSMGLAVTDLNEETRVETEIEVSGNKIEFILNGQPLEKEKMRDLEKIIRIFEKESGKKISGLKIKSENYKIYSGSSDAGAAALVVALDAIFETEMARDELAEISMLLSESSVSKTSCLYGSNLQSVSISFNPKSSNVWNN